jgi:L-ascorbate metabolism protein UlaG (beta-lactamase superfamily)
MRLTKLGHACVRLTEGDRTLVLDPGAFSEPAAALEGAQAVLITHEHADHVDVEAVTAALAADSALHVWAPTAVAAGFGDRATAVGPGETFEAAGFTIGTYGGQHAPIHTAIPLCANVGFRVTDGQASVYHPGDSYAVPTDPVSLLLLPTSGPWLSVGAAIDFATAVRAPKAVQIHDALLSDLGATVTENIVGGVIGQYGVAFSHLGLGESVSA